MISITFSAIFDLAGIEETNLLFRIPDVAGFTLITSINSTEFTVNTVFDVASHIFATGRGIIPTESIGANLTFAYFVFGHMVVTFAEIAD